MLPDVDLGSVRTARMIFAGGNNTCAILDNDELKCWGDNNSGQLGLGDTTDRDEPENAIDLGSGRTARMLAVGTGHTCAILDDDSLKCWGGNSFGQLGLGDVEPGMTMRW